ncbi:MAG: phytanoyl-CoA dioxygenase family protein [Armatimonadetes bacterium]|nr:phytanoyl-CoA dioxygenase family protein [Armatimonadota bacterium]
MLEPREVAELAARLEAVTERALVTAGLAGTGEAGEAALATTRLALPDVCESLGHHPELRGRAESLLGAPARLTSCTCRLKPPLLSGLLWRQECARFLPLPSRMLCLSVALDDAIEETGCLVVLPRSHRDGLMPHLRRGGEWLLEANRAAAEQVGGHQVLVPAGGAVFYDGYLLHATTSNRGMCWRRAIQLTFVPADEHCRPRD